MQDQTHLPKTLTLAVTNLVLSFRFLEGKALRDDDMLQNLPVGTSVILYFRDLGPQLGWKMVSDLQNVTLDSIKHTIFKKNHCSAGFSGGVHGSPSDISPLLCPCPVHL